MGECDQFDGVTKLEGSIWATSSRGKTKGDILVPHQNKRGKYAGFYIASKSKFERDYIPVRELEALPRYVAQGYSIRMSPRSGIGAANLINPQSIRGWR